MRKRWLAVFIIMAFSVILPMQALAATIKPVADPWDDPKNLKKDGGTYLTNGKSGYVIVWETPECEVDGEYVLLDNNTQIVVEHRVTYMESVPWGHVSLELAPDKSGNVKSFSGWVLMTELLDEHGEPAAILPPDIPEHPMIKNPEPVASVGPVMPQTTPQIQNPQTPSQAITISNTYNNAIVYTSMGIAVAAVIIVIIVLIKHKAVNKNGE